MLKKEVTPKRAPMRLSHAPSMAELSQAFTEGARNPGNVLAVSWAAEQDRGAYVLTVHFSSPSAEPDWLFELSSDGNPTALWAYSTSDILLVSNLIASSMQSLGAHLAANGQSEMKAAEGYNEVYMSSDAYYRQCPRLARERSTAAISWWQAATTNSQNRSCTLRRPGPGRSGRELLTTFICFI